jgi:hypothetical protein
LFLVLVWKQLVLSLSNWISEAALQNSCEDLPGVDRGVAAANAPGMKDAFDMMLAVRVVPDLVICLARACRDAPTTSLATTGEARTIRFF